MKTNVTASCMSDKPRPRESLVTVGAEQCSEGGVCHSVGSQSNGCPNQVSCDRYGTEALAPGYDMVTGQVTHCSGPFIMLTLLASNCYQL